MKPPARFLAIASMVALSACHLSESDSVTPERSPGGLHRDHGGGGAVGSDFVAVGFGGQREKPSVAEAAAIHLQAKASLKDIQLFLPLRQGHDVGANVAASPNDAVFSWRKDGYVTPARDQGSCGSCWAFAAVGAAEANWALRHNKSMIDASEQHVLNCAPGNCSRGRLSDAMAFLVTKGTCNEADDPYVSQKHSCSTKPSTYKPVARDYVASGGIPTVQQLKKALLEHGPIAAFVYAKGMNKKSWFGADVVITDNPKEDDPQYNHFILIVGWDDTKANGKGAWEIKNSWRDDNGTWWGNKGFAFIRYDVRSVGDNAMWLEFTPGTPSPHFLPQSKFGIE